MNYWQNALPGSLKGKLESVRSVFQNGGPIANFKKKAFWSTRVEHKWCRPIPFCRYQQCRHWWLSVSWNTSKQVHISLIPTLALSQHIRSFFSSYQRVASGWNYVMGNFAQQSLPILDEATLTVIRVNSSVPETFIVRKSLVFLQKNTHRSSSRTVQESVQARETGQTANLSAPTTA